MSITQQDARAFFGYARERYRIHLRRSTGDKWPWTKDPILQQFRFCNIFREDDTVTKWIRSHIRPMDYSNSDLFSAILIARWFNRIETLEILDKAGLLSGLDIPAIETKLHDVHPIVNAAYIISSPKGKKKLEGILWCIEQILDDVPALTSKITPATALQEVHSWLVPYPYLGDFTAYEVVTDLRHTLLCNAPDILTWAQPGPGAKRGYGRISSGDPHLYKRPSSGRGRFPNKKHGKRYEGEIMQGMRQLLDFSRIETFWPSKWPAWEMREVEHTLCEFDKYERTRLGQGTAKQRYRRPV